MQNLEKPMFSEMVKKARRPRGWTQVELARLLEIEPNTVSRWERGSHIPKETGIINKLCELFEMNPEELGLLEEKSSFFLSFARVDADCADRLKADLAHRGILLENEKGLVDTAEHGQILRRALRKARAVIFLASPQASCSPTVRKELELAHLYGRPVYALWIAGQQRKDVLPAHQTGVRAIDTFDARSTRYETAVDELVTMLGQFSQSVSEPRNPYKGLLPFNGENAQDFFGREQLIEKLVDELEQILKREKMEDETSRMLSVIGPSGSGKSSVVQAGLLPTLQQEELPGSRHWLYLQPMTPGEHPIELLALTLQCYLKDRSYATLSQDLWDKEARGLHVLVKQLMKQPETKVVLVVDQFEELFIRVKDERERQQFLDLLVNASTVSEGSLVVILTLRADFYDRPMQYPAFYRLLQSHLVAVLPMEIQELRHVIEKPAQLPEVQLTFEENLVEELLFDVQGQSGALPLLQFTLDQLFHGRDKQRLTRQAYQEIGGMKGALANHADSTYLALPSDEHRRLARALFLRLIDAGTVDQDATRRRAALSELVLSNLHETATLQKVMAAFTAARLLTTITIAGVPFVEVSHEALIKKWIRLTTWLQEAYEDIRLQKAFSGDVAEWIRHSKPSDRLYRGTQLLETQAWRTRNIPSRDEEEFLQASNREREQEEEAEYQRQQLEKQTRRKYTRRTILIGGGSLGLTLAAFRVGGLWIPQGNISPQGLVQGLPYTYPGHAQAVLSAAWSPDGQLIASGGMDRTVQVWNPNTANLMQLVQIYRGHTDAVRSVVWSPNSQLIASGAADETVQIWEASTGRHLFTYLGHSRAVLTVAWSSDGKYIASGGDDNTVQVWEANTGRHLSTYQRHLGSVMSIAWSPNGKFVASAGDGNTVQAWEASTGRQLSTYQDHTVVWVGSVAWSPDGQRIASGGLNSTISSFDNTRSVHINPLYVWEASTGRPVLTYRGHTQAVTSIAWAHDSRHIASGGYDKAVKVWEANTGHSLHTYGHSDTVRSVTWSPDGKYIASASDDHTVQICLGS